MGEQPAGMFSFEAPLNYADLALVDPQDKCVQEAAFLTLTHTHTHPHSFSLPLQQSHACSLGIHPR